MKKRIIFLFITAVLLLSLACCGRKDDRQISLSNPNADSTTQEIYKYIVGLEENYCLSAQQESTWMGSADYEMDYIYEASGRYPAMRGLDYMNDDFEGVNERAVEWWNKGGLVTICWHTGSDFFGEWKDSQEDEITDWEAVFTEGTAENKALIEGMDKGARALKDLQEKSVTVIWRPFHELDGGWFWWGKGSAENFVRLWRTMYDRYTDYWKLDNLIWVLGYSHMGEDYEDWYPGDGYCDIIGADSYDIKLLSKLCRKVKRVADKPLCFHECGDNPTVKQLQKTDWLWFMTWHTEYLTDRNTAEELRELYNSDYIITLDELPKVWG